MCVFWSQRGGWQTLCQRRDEQREFHCFKNTPKQILNERMMAGVSACDPPWLPSQTSKDLRSAGVSTTTQEGRKPVLLSRALVIDNAIALPQVAACVRACLHFGMSQRVV